MNAADSAPERASASICAGCIERASNIERASRTYTSVMMIPETLKQMVKASPLYPVVQGALEQVRSRRELDSWVAAGSVGAPPHRVKQGVLRTYAQRFGLRTLVETGTYLGSMVHAMRHDFQVIHTVEVDAALATLARRRFAGLSHVTVHQGDSTTVLPEILRTLNGPALFWLDGHYSGGITSMGAKESPIIEEMEALMADRERRHVILIDDARCFGDTPDYPTLDEFQQIVAKGRPDLKFEVEHDIIRLTPEG